MEIYGTYVFLIIVVAMKSGASFQFAFCYSSSRSAHDLWIHFPSTYVEMFVLHHCGCIWGGDAFIDIKVLHMKLPAWDTLQNKGKNSSNGWYWLVYLA